MKMHMKKHSKPADVALNLARLMGALSLLLGAVVLLGWYLHEPALIQINPAFVPMQYNTALGFAIGGLALLGLAGFWPRIAGIASIIVLLTGALTLIEYIFAVDLHIDQLFMEHYIDLKTSNPGRMAPNTALCFTLTGLTVLPSTLFHKRARTTAWTATLGAIIISLGVTALAGYMIGVEGAYGWGHMTRMAIHTAVGFIALGGGFVALAWSDNRRISPTEALPHWMPRVIGITGATITFALWQAMSAQEQRMVSEMGAGAENFSNEGLLIFGILLTFILAFRTRTAAVANRGDRSNQDYAPYIAITLGALLAASLHSLLQTSSESAVKHRFDAAVVNHVEAIEHGIDAYLETLYHIRSAFNASSFVDRDEFHTLVSRSLARNPGVMALEWVPRVTAQQRDAMEAAAREELSADFVFSDDPAERGMRAASQRDVYFPIFYAEPQKLFSSVLGFDLAARPDHFAALLKAAHSNAPAVSARLQLYLSEEGTYSIFVALPVYRKGVPLKTAGERESALRGFAVMVTEIGPMVESILGKNTSPAGLTLTFEDSELRDAEAFLYRHVSRAIDLGPDNTEKDYLDDGLTSTATLAFADHNWQVTAHAANHTIYSDWRASSLWLPLGVLLLSVGLAWFLHRLRQAEDVQRMAKEAANAANHAKSAFLANMSHELRTPMNAILGYSEMLMEEAEDLEQEEFIPDLKKINQAGTHLLALINDVLDLSKIESGKMEAFAESIDLDSLIDEVSTTAQPLMEKNRNRLSIERSQHLGSAHQDRTKLRQALFNLLSNAAKFTQGGSITLHVGRIQQSGEDWLSFAVSDTGIGIAPDKLKHIFEEFTQADDSTTRDYGGTGLGLAISQRICKLLGGNLSVISELGEGSTFTIHLPATLPGTVSSPEATAQGPSVKTTQAITATELETSRDTVPGSTILVIDDDPQACEIIERYLVKDGFNVATANSGEQGLRLAHECQPAAITLDVMMPDMDGWSVLRALKADPVLRKIPVIMLTMIDDRTRGYSLGAVDYLTKPIDRELLHSSLSRYSSDDNSAVLLVEDDMAAREIMASTLEKSGWAVSEAGNGQEALDVMASMQPCLILLDLMMPVMDGFDFLAALRGRPEWRYIPVIVVTAKDLTENDRERLNGRVEEVLEKNACSREELLEHVREAIASSNIKH